MLYAVVAIAALSMVATLWALHAAREAWQVAHEAAVRARQAAQREAQTWDLVAQAFGMAAENPVDGWLWLAAALEVEAERRER